ncbi:UNVERIFIED_CONTAM: Callose synthase 9, partial [Sesamum angustifolium]
MSRVEDLWERLVRAALRGRRAGVDLYGRPEAGLAAIVPSSLGNRDIDDILRAADEIQDDDPNVSRILCEHAYSLAQNLDPNSEGRGVLQFKTGLMSVIKIYGLLACCARSEIFFCLFPSDEWKNFLARIGRHENASELELNDNPNHILELRFWASYRGQTLARTVRGMMYYRKALMLQAYLERMSAR